MTNKDENINNEKEDNITLETESSEQSKNIEEEMTAATNETEENKDCGKLPQNKKDKKNKWLLLVLGIATVIVAGLLTTKFLSKDSEPKNEPIDYMQYVQGIQDLEITSSKDKYDYLTNITFDKEHINEVTVDDTQVDLTKAGEYQLTYLIDVKDEKVEDLKQVVTVKVVTAKKEDNKKPVDTKDKDKPSSSQNQTDTNNQSKPSNTGSSNNNTGTSSQPSNSGSSNNTNKKPTSPTHTHRYVAEYKDIQHEEKGHYETVTVSEAWDEPIYNTYEIMICNACGLEMYSAEDYYNHSDSMGFGHGAWHNEWKQDLVDTIHHPAKTKKQWVVDENGWTETVTIYKCSCGATK